MKVLVFGGRDYSDRSRVWSCLDSLLGEHGDDLIIIHGGCETGADKFAENWCLENEVDCVRVPAKWRRHNGRRAGPWRNYRMASVFKPDKAMQFPGGTGTASMAAICNEFRIPITEYA